MKHLKSYKIFESSDTPQEVKTSCEDILLDLVDDGFKTIVTVDGTWVNGSLYAEHPKSWVKVVISRITDVDPSDNESYRRDFKFRYEDIKETANRLSGYLSQSGFKPDDDFGNMVARTEAVRNPNNFALIGIRSFVNLWYTRDEKDTINESQSDDNLKSHLDSIKDMFSDITDEYDIGYKIYYHHGIYGGKKQNDPAIFVDIEIDKKLIPVNKFLKEIFTFADRVSSHCGLRTNYSLGGDDIPGGQLQRGRILRDWHKNYGEYFQIYFTEK